MSGKSYQSSWSFSANICAKKIDLSAGDKVGAATVRPAMRVMRARSAAISFFETAEKSF